MDPTNHPDELVNIVTGKVAPGTINVGLSVQIGTSQLREFEESLPDGFNSTIAKKIVIHSLDPLVLLMQTLSTIESLDFINHGVFSLIKYCITN